MIPYWIVLYEFGQNLRHRSAVIRMRARQGECAVAMYDTYDEAKAEADKWLTRGLGRWPKQKRRVTISGPFYREGFK